MFTPSTSSPSSMATTQTSSYPSNTPFEAEDTDDHDAEVVATVPAMHAQINHDHHHPPNYWSRSSDAESKANWLVQEWNRVFLLVSTAGLFVDPLFFYSLSISDTCMCLFVDGWFAVTVTTLQCMADAAQLYNLWLQLRISHRMRRRRSSRSEEEEEEGGGKGLGHVRSKKEFLFDLFITLPIPQVMNFLAYFLSLLRYDAL